MRWCRPGRASPAARRSLDGGTSFACRERAETSRLYSSLRPFWRFKSLQIMTFSVEHLKCFVVPVSGVQVTRTVTALDAHEHPWSCASCRRSAGSGGGVRRRNPRGTCPGGRRRRCGSPVGRCPRTSGSRRSSSGGTLSTWSGSGRRSRAGWGPQAMTSLRPPTSIGIRFAHLIRRHSKCRTAMSIQFHP